MKIYSLNIDNNYINKIISLFTRFSNIDIKGCPELTVVTDLPVNDVYEIDGDTVYLPVAVVSYETYQKYLVLLEDGRILIPVPVRDNSNLSKNWRIYEVRESDILTIISLLSSYDSSFNDFFDLVEIYGQFQRMYY